MGRDYKIVNRLHFVLTIILVGFTGNVTAQQNALYSQYMFNPFSVNPAYAGSRQATSAVLLYRNHWVGLDGAPVSQTLSIHSPLKGKNVGLGFNVLNETIGPRSNIACFGTYAYHITLPIGKLSMGLRAGGYRLQVEEALFDFKNKSETYDNNYFNGKFIPSFDFGAYYYSNQFYSGISITHLVQGKNGQINEDFLNYSQIHSHLILTIGYANAVNDWLVLKPSSMVRYMVGAPTNIDINLSALIKRVFWIGFSYRTAKDLVLISEFNLTDFIRAGYSYDFILSEVKSYSTGSHEIFLGIDFDVRNKKTLQNPRMF